jgi:hypothetical protein
MFRTRWFIFRKTVYIQLWYNMLYMLKLRLEAFIGYLSMKYLNF